MRPATRCLARGMVLARASCSSSQGTMRSREASATPPSDTSSYHPAVQSTSTPFAVLTPVRRYTAPSRPLRQLWKQNRVRPWMCTKKECHNVNRAVAMECDACGTPKPALMKWKCVGCGSVNFDGVKACKKCKEPSEVSKSYWMCAECGENNRVDNLEDNSVCGFCGYNMAPRTAIEEEHYRRTLESGAAQQQQQEHYDSVTFREADEQFSNPLDGAEQLNPSLRTPHAPAEPASDTSAGSARRLWVPKIAPYVPSNEPPQTRHSKLYRRKTTSVAQDMVDNAAQTPKGPPGFDWMCRVPSCGHINPGDEEECLKCHAHIQPCKWECLLCGALNHLTRSRCFNCKSVIPVCWTCQSCNTPTSIYDEKCRNCGIERPTTEPKTPREVEKSIGYNKAGITPQRDQRRGDWYCSACNALNYSRRTECFQCSTARPSEDMATVVDAFAGTGWGQGDGSSLASQTPAAALQNNWICAYCQASNFRTRHDCWKCGRASEQQQEWSKDTVTPHYEHEGFQSGAASKAAEGQMNTAWKPNQDTWVCAKCYATNFRSRGECYRCGASKVAVRTPHRTKARKPVKL